MHWRITYRDGSRFDENVPAPCLSGPHDGPHGWKCVDQKHIDRLGFYEDGDASAAISVFLGAGDRPILFRRNIVQDALGVLGEPRRTVIPVVGWQRTVDGRNVQCLRALMPDGSILETGDSADIVWPQEEV